MNNYYMCKAHKSMYGYVCIYICGGREGEMKLDNMSLCEGGEGLDT